MSDIQKSANIKARAAYMQIRLKSEFVSLILKQD